MILGLASIATACFKNANNNCCSIANISLNLTRVCGLFGDQDCPDRVSQNTGNVTYVVPVDGAGRENSTTGQAFVCSYYVGRCRGTFGSNLCVYGELTTISCSSSRATGKKCPPVTTAPGPSLDIVGPIVDREI